MNRALLLLATIWKLGLRSVARVALYRLGIRSGLHPVFRARPMAIGEGVFFDPPARDGGMLRPTDVWKDRPWAFGYPVGEASSQPPDWHANIFTGKCVEAPARRWDRIAAFDPSVGDIKTVWEASRMDWALAFAQRAVAGQPGMLDTLNRWMADWSERNPPYRGPNWMCAQEASIRVAHLALVSRILGREQAPTPALQALLFTHLRRIAPTTSYARGQDNNHGTSEAMALFVGGAWLARIADDAELRCEGTRYATAGRKLLEERVARLISSDGGFAQYSIVYHRLMLDTLSLAECWRRWMDAEPFSDHFMTKAAAASRWLAALIDPITGDAPNYGNNDGAWLLPIGSGGARDFRPSAALASTLFEGGTRFAGARSSIDLLEWLAIAPLDALDSRASGVSLLDGSGLILAEANGRCVMLRLPGTRFRPHQSDALHLDLWQDGVNMLRDGGSYSYACDAPLLPPNYFTSPAAHNAIEFDGREQMPRLGRFLYGRWLKRRKVEIDGLNFCASMRDYRNASHARRIEIADDLILVEDEIGGEFTSATLRWRLAPSEWSLSDQSLVSEFGTITLSLPEGAEVALTQGWESRHYLQMTGIPVCEIRLSRPGVVRSEFRLTRSAS